MPPLRCFAQIRSHAQLAASHHAAPPLPACTGRRLLLDCGTATFKTGLAYLLSRYRQEAVEFDEVSERSPTQAA